jgi:hypothetical protein
MPPGYPPMTVQPVNPPPAAPSKMSGGKMLLIVLAIIAGLSVPVIGIVAALGIYGTKKYLTNAKMAEGRTNVVSLAKGIVACARQVDPATGKARGLPGTSLAVPATLAEVKGVKYQSAPGEWGDPAFTCAGFKMFGPQYFQYRWEQRSESSGAALAIADLDGDGSADGSLEQPVNCSAGGACALGSMQENEP